eukprot:TRINITY_DN2228_c0_g1_i13.p1 TRINITY_DN2228_c0_g1~~TRINITY_DN2228_c0_g1_i13.p1  ORF type:complete len:118 (+),score=26.98 TRINITY_DN2228_c0_g1_i13:88-441(+)
MVMPTMIYVYWQVSYFLKTEVVDHDKLESDVDLQTSLRWLSASTKSPVYKLLQYYNCPKNLYVFAFMCMMGGRGRGRGRERDGDENSQCVPDNSKRNQFSHAIIVHCVDGVAYQIDV